MLRDLYSAGIIPVVAPVATGMEENETFNVNGDTMKIWTCYAGLAAQQWFYTGDQRIALENERTFQCVFVRSSSSDHDLCRAMPRPNQRQHRRQHPDADLGVHHR